MKIIISNAVMEVYVQSNLNVWEYNLPNCFYFRTCVRTHFVHLISYGNIEVDQCILGLSLLVFVHLLFNFNNITVYSFDLVFQMIYSLIMFLACIKLSTFLNHEFIQSFIMNYTDFLCT